MAWIRGHQLQKPFEWTADDGTELWPGFPHEGLPKRWSFGFATWPSVSELQGAVEVQVTEFGQSQLVDECDC